jgi:hypothetical protein
MRGCLGHADSSRLAHSFPGAKRASDRDDLTQMIGVVVVQEQNRPEVRLVVLAGRNEGVCSKPGAGVPRSSAGTPSIARSKPTCASSQSTNRSS